MLDRTIAPALQELSHVSLPQAQVEKFTNGAKVHYLENPTPEVLRFEIVFPAGKWYEPSKGVSYFASKLLLEGTKTRSAKQIADILDFYGASLECNQGFDWSTLTLYCLSKHFASIFPIVKEILEEPSFPEQEFLLLKQRTKQSNQIERKKPAYLATELFSKSIYGSEHPYVSGLTEEEISSVNLEKVKAFYNEYYHVTASEIFVCGNISSSDKLLIKEWLEKLPDKEKFIIVTPQHQRQLTLFERSLSIAGSMQAAIRMGKEFPLITDPDYLPLTVLNKILGGYFGSRLMKNIREDKGLTYGIYSTLSVRKHSTMFFIGSDVNTDKAELAISEINNELLSLKTKVVEEEELNTIKNYMIGKFLNETTTVFDQTDRYKHLVLFELPTNHFDLYLNTIKSITPLSILELSNKYFKDLIIIKAG
jgi:zinc protease